MLKEDQYSNKVQTQYAIYITIECMCFQFLVQQIQLDFAIQGQRTKWLSGGRCRHGQPSKSPWSLRRDHSRHGAGTSNKHHCHLKLPSSQHLKKNWNWACGAVGNEVLDVGFGREPVGFELRINVSGSGLEMGIFQSTKVRFCWNWGFVERRKKLGSCCGCLHWRAWEGDFCGLNGIFESEGFTRVLGWQRWRRTERLLRDLRLRLFQGTHKMKRVLLYIHTDIFFI